MPRKPAPKAELATVPMPSAPSVHKVVEDWRDINVVDAASAFAIEMMDRCLDGRIEVRNAREAASLIGEMRGLISDMRPQGGGGIIEARLVDATNAVRALDAVEKARESLQQREQEQK